MPRPLSDWAVRHSGPVSTGAEVVVGLVILVGVVGIIVPVLPGTLLVLAAIGVWAFQVGTTAGWVVFSGATLAVTAAFVAKYAWPGRRLKAAGVPNAALMVGGLCALVGFFVIPFVGLFVGFPLGVYLYELQRQQTQEAAWESTKHAMKAAGVSILIELAGALFAAGLWLFGAVALT